MCWWQACVLGKGGTDEAATALAVAVVAVGNGGTVGIPIATSRHAVCPSCRYRCRGFGEGGSKKQK